ncbi:hypothetical protein [Rugosimonospora africana]|uniref:Glycoside hydrolase family 5 domain-containing protein n=1 Tax=Rugosimonospora africana TaxID=556532 RepID=A0A8J3R1W3_9ACTN|nr:hypothetical protein [Rugosimonospora africana]GIH20716.1 hypothetical protein Raf01_88880 [Rugosimonospora africana]
MITMPDLPGIRLGVVRGISYGLFGRPDEFLPAARGIGAGLVRVYLYWGQVEPEPGRYVWDTVDALLRQLDGDEEIWVTVCSSSPWATRVATDFLPPSPAKDPDTYGAFIRALVRHCAGRVRYWQCDNEPSNDLLWSGTADEYVAQLATMHRAVREADPTAAVVLGGCGYDVLSSAEGSEPRRFFDHVVREGREWFDLFDVHLYGDPARVPDYLQTARQLMRAHGYARPIVAGEHGGPVPFEFPEVDSVVQEVFVSAFATPPASQSTDELIAQATQLTPERRAMTALYARMSDLPPRLQMFLHGCPPEWEAKRHRINCRQIVARTVLALAGGVGRLAYWNLAPEVPGATDPYQMMHLMFGKLPILDYRDGALRHRHPGAGTFALLAGQLAGAVAVSRLETPGWPGGYAFEVERADRDRLLVLWDGRDTFDGEDEPPVSVALPWPADAATAIDAFGEPVASRVDGGTLRLEVTDTPVFVSPA